uniref:Dual specificity protein phosphatase n=1 Tax=Oryzias latipes TaxID=8090 RepID=A0A3P9H8S9_ORYLA
MSGSKQQHDLLLIRELELILDSCKLELTAVDEIWPSLFLGNVAAAQNKKILRDLSITHVLNAAHSKQGSIGDQSFYGSTCVYFGIPAEDSDHFDLSQYFKVAADFIHKGLQSKEGKVRVQQRGILSFSKHLQPHFFPFFFTGRVLVHCIMGVSRSATLILAYLMLKERLTLRDALRQVVQKRAIYPNRNFLSLLLKLDEQLERKRRLCPLL